jgi:hypothetical protein
LNVFYQDQKHPERRERKPPFEGSMKIASN